MSLFLMMNGFSMFKIVIPKTDWQNFARDEKRVQKQIEKWLALLKDIENKEVKKISRWMPFAYA